MRRLMKAVAVTLVLGISAGAHAAVVVFDNMTYGGYLTHIGGANYGPNRFGAGSPATLQGMQFVPSASGYLSSVFAPMTIDAGSEIEVVLTLWSDGGDLPLSIVESSSRRVSAVTGGAILEWGWLGTSLIEEGMKYWLVAQTDEPNAVVSWQYVPGYLWTSAVRANRTLGEDWQIFLGNGGETAMRIEAAPVPVPASLPLLVGALLLAGTFGGRTGTRRVTENRRF